MMINYSNCGVVLFWSFYFLFEANEMPRTQTLKKVKLLKFGILCVIINKRWSDVKFFINIFNSIRAWHVSNEKLENTKCNCSWIIWWTGLEHQKMVYPNHTSEVNTKWNSYTLSWFLKSSTFRLGGSNPEGIQVHNRECT